MKTVYDVAQLLRKHGIIVYLGKRQYDIEMMEYEITELFNHNILDRETFARARSILKQELIKEQRKNSSLN
ncbi:TPA: YqgQ family protein [Listeria monocytogenes]|nr:YqgQ family protein [Listeria monocytogenes]